MTDAVLFDWDGTLLDSRDALLASWHASTEQVLGRRFPADEAEEELVFTMPGTHLFPRVAGDLHKAAELTAAFQTAYEENGRLVRAFPGVVALVTDLRHAGVGIAVVTSKSRVRYDIDARAIGVQELIDVAVCQEDTEAHKPDPAPVRHALRALGVAPADATMAGDTPVDVAAAAAAGVTAIGVAWGASAAQPLLDAGAAAVAADATELRSLVLHAQHPVGRIAT